MKKLNILFLIIAIIFLGYGIISFDPTSYAIIGLILLLKAFDRI